MSETGGGSGVDEDDDDDEWDYADVTSTRLSDLHTHCVLSYGFNWKDQEACNY